MAFPYRHSIPLLSWDTNKVERFYPPIDLRTLEDKIEQLKRRNRWQ